MRMAIDVLEAAGRAAVHLEGAKPDDLPITAAAAEVEARLGEGVILCGHALWTSGLPALVRARPSLMRKIREVGLEDTVDTLVLMRMAKPNDHLHELEALAARWSTDRTGAALRAAREGAEALETSGWKILVRTALFWCEMQARGIPVDWKEASKTQSRARADRLLGDSEEQVQANELLTGIWHLRSGRRIGDMLIPQFHILAERTGESHYSSPQLNQISDDVLKLAAVRPVDQEVLMARVDRPEETVFSCALAANGGDPFANVDPIDATVEMAAGQGLLDACQNPRDGAAILNEGAARGLSDFWMLSRLGLAVTEDNKDSLRFFQALRWPSLTRARKALEGATVAGCVSNLHGVWVRRNGVDALSTWVRNMAAFHCYNVLGRWWDDFRKNAMAGALVWHHDRCWVVTRGD